MWAVFFLDKLKCWKCSSNNNLFKKKTKNIGLSEKCVIEKLKTGLFPIVDTQKKRCFVLQDCLYLIFSTQLKQPNYDQQLSYTNTKMSPPNSKRKAHPKHSQGRSTIYYYYFVELNFNISSARIKLVITTSDDALLNTWNCALGWSESAAVKETHCSHLKCCTDVVTCYSEVCGHVWDKVTFGHVKRAFKG